MLDIVEIIEFLNFIYCMAELLEFTAFLHLRRSLIRIRVPLQSLPFPRSNFFLFLEPHEFLSSPFRKKPDLPRPYKVPLGDTACAVALIPTFGLIIVVMSLASSRTLLLSAVVVLIGIPLPALCQHAKVGHCDFILTLNITLGVCNIRSIHDDCL